MDVIAGITVVLRVTSVQSQHRGAVHLRQGPGPTGRQRDAGPARLASQGREVVM